MKQRVPQSIQLASIVALSQFFGANVYGQTPPKQVDQAAFRTAVREAREAMDAGDFAAATLAYTRAVEADPSNSRALYNRGVAQYKDGSLKEAAESFAEAAQSAEVDLAAQSMFNQGNAIYAQAIKGLETDHSDTPGDPTETRAGSPDLKGAIEAVTNALTHFKDAATADSSDVDARVNAETATRLLKLLEEEKEKQDQKQDQQQQDEQGQEKQEQQKDQQGEPKDDQSKQDQSAGEQSGQQPPEQPKESKPEADKNEQPKDGETKDKAQDEPQGQQGEQGQQSEGEPSQNKQTEAGDPVKNAPLTKQEAEQLLQAVRDRDKARREAKDQATQSKRTPTSKDW